MTVPIQTLSFWEILLNRILYITIGNISYCIFSDGDADVYIYANYELKYYLLYYIAAAFISIFLWILLFAIGIGKR